MRVPFSESQGANCIGLFKKKPVYSSVFRGKRSPQFNDIKHRKEISDRL